MPKRRQETTDSRRSWAAKGKTRDVCESCRKSKIRCTGCAEFACEACTKKKILCIPAPQKNPTVRRRAASQSWTENAGPNDGLDEPVESQEDYEEQSAGSSQVEAVAGEDVDENETHISSFVSTTPEFELVFQDNMQFDNYTLMDHFIVGKFHVAMLYFNSPSQPFIVRWKFDDNLQRWSYFDGPTEPKKFVEHTDTNGIIPYSSVLQSRMLNGEGTTLAMQDITSDPTDEGMEGFSSSNTNKWGSLTNGNASLGESQSLGMLEQWFGSGTAIGPRSFVTDQSY